MKSFVSIVSFLVLLGCSVNSVERKPSSQEATDNPGATNFAPPNQNAKFKERVVEMEPHLEIPQGSSLAVDHKKLNNQFCNVTFTKLDDYNRVVASVQTAIDGLLSFPILVFGARDDSFPFKEFKSKYPETYYMDIKEASKSAWEQKYGYWGYSDNQFQRVRQIRINGDIYYLKHSIGVDPTASMIDGVMYEIRRGTYGQDFQRMALQARFFCTPLGTAL